MFDFTPRAVYRGQIATLEHDLRVKDAQIEKKDKEIANLRTEVNTADSAIRSLNNEVKRLVNESEERKVVAGNIINDQRKKIRNLEKQIAELKDALNEAKPRYYRGKNGRFTKKVAEPQQ